MNRQQDPRIRIITGPGTGLVGRILYFVLGLALLVAAFFFIGIALVAGAIIAVVLLARWWWLQRRLRKAETDAFVEGEYRVVETAITEQREPPR